MRTFGKSALLCCAMAGALSGSVFAQAGRELVRARITRPINEGRLSRLPGNTHPLARGEFDRGLAPPDLPMQRMLLVLTRGGQEETALQNLLDQQQDRTSSLYHHWLTPEEFGQQFGAAEQDVQTVTAWLQSHGFQIARVSNGRSIIEFSGTAAQVEGAFHTEIHKYVVNGKIHWANASDPEIPSALASVVAGVATLHNFSKRPQLIRSNGVFQKSPEFTNSSGGHALAPADYATIYNINPVYDAGISGAGTVIAVVGRSNINLQDIASFRSTFNLPANPPQVVVDGADPGDLGGDEEAEAVLDTSCAGAVAPGATVKLVVSKSTNTTDGVDLSEEYIIDHNLGDVMTESFGNCEASYTAAEAAAISSLAQQAAAQGITYTVASGDSGAEGCDDPSGETTATGPVSVNILASTPYTIAVGGTEFNENGNNAAYWQTTNAADGASAISYIPEDVWNESCTAGQCTTGNSPGLWAGGGGASTLFGKPAWQTGVPGIPNDGARDVPDVALTAAGHDAYLLCIDGSCTPNKTGRISFQGYSGTSAATPSFAGVMALIVQRTGSRLGQANYVLYSLAASQAAGSCNASSASPLPAASCIFNDVTLGNNAVPGESGYGTSAARYQAGAGYDLATGLGSVNVANLAENWNAVKPSSAFHAGIDQPGSVQSTFIGLSVFSGWALNNNSGISSVQLSIDGVPYGAAGYGGYRTDICALYPGGVGCPNVGWSAVIDTTQLADGTHTLDALATSRLGDHSAASASFTVANWSAADPMVMTIDRPASNGGAFTGVVGFGGWALDKSGSIAGVSMSVDGVPYGAASYGAERPDVCAFYPGVMPCPHVGWNVVLDTRLLPGGPHILAMTGFTVQGQNTTVSTSFTTTNLSSTPMLISIDTPHGLTPVSGLPGLGGWAFDSNAAVSKVTVSIDGVIVGNAMYGGARPDVCAAFPNKPGCPNVGWNFRLSTTGFSNGNHTISVTATAVNGDVATAGAPFVVANPTGGTPLRMNIDQPSAQNAIVTGVMAFTGWAVDDNAFISTVSISVDGLYKGVAGYGGNRPDVCAALPGRPDCPHVGWAFWLDTTLLTNGPHTLAVTGTSMTNDQLTLSAPFTVSNWSTDNPIKIAIDSPNPQAPIGGSVVFGGWAVSDIAGIKSVSVAIDSVPVGSGNYGVNRADVCAVLPGKANCPKVGWDLAFDTTSLANGAHTLSVTALSSGGQYSTATAAFTVSNSSPVTIGIDRPVSSSGAFSGTAPFGGWALNQTSGIAIAAVKILIDGVFNGMALYGGNRPDVCNVFPGKSGCPDVGWNYLLDTTVLANGAHQLEVTAVSTNGQQATASSSFTVMQ